MPNRVIAIGDIHGCAEALRALLEVVDSGEDDQLIALGDFVDRGTNTREVIDQLIDLDRRCHFIPLLGNHEVMMLDALSSHNTAKLDFWLHCGGEETIASYGGDFTRIPQAHLDFLETCHSYYENEHYLFVHANYHAELPLNRQPHHALFWQHLTEIPPPHNSGKVAIVGHTPQLSGEVLDLGHIICIDTFCFGSGWLTALDVHSREIWQVDKQGNLRLDDRWQE